MQIETRLSDQLSRYLDLAVERDETDGRQHGQHRYAGVSDAGIRLRDGDAARRSETSDATENVNRFMCRKWTALISRPDGNNVSMDREGLKLAEAQLKFKTGVALMRLENQRVMDAIHADK